jgi:hypothetical protein
MPPGIVRSVSSTAPIVPQHGPSYTPLFVSDYPPGLPGEIVARYGHAFDVDDRLFRAIDALAPIDGRDVLLLAASDDGPQASRVVARGGRVSTTMDASTSLPGSADIVVGLWPELPTDGAASVLEDALVTLARPGGLALVVQDYGRDDRGALTSTAATTSATTSVPDPSMTPGRREAPYLARGWKVRVIHCFWTFATLDEARGFVGTFGEPGQILAARLRRPRVSHNLALLHRTTATSP